MGLFDGSLTGDPTGDLGVIGGLLTARVGSNWPQLLTQAAAMHQSQQNQERQNRTNELAQISGVYKIAKDMDEQQFWADQMAGRPHVPNPTIAQLEGRMNELSGLPAITRTPTGYPSAPSAPAPQSPPMQRVGPSPMPGMPGMPAARPDLQPGPMPQGQPTQQAPPTQPAAQAPQVVGQDISFPKLLEMSGIQPSVAAGYVRIGKTDKLLDAINEAFKIRGSGGNFVRLNPSTGQMEFMGGQVQPNSFPVTASPGGGLEVQPVRGLNQAIAEQTTAKTTAEESAKSQFALTPVKTPDGRTLYLTQQQILQMTGAGAPQGVPAQPQPGAAQIPPAVQSQRDNTRMQILLAERDTLAKQGRTDPALEREIQLAQGKQAPGFVTGQTTAQQTAAETNPKLQLDLLQKSFEDNSRNNDALQFIDVAKKSIQNGAFTGALANPQLLAARFGAAFGIPSDARVADTQTFAAMAARQVMGTIKSLGSGSGISDSDREYAANAMGGNIKLDQSTILRLMDIQERAVRRGVEMHNQRATQAEAAGVPNVFSYKIDPYKPSSAATGDPLSVNVNGKVYRFPSAAAAAAYRQQTGAQ